ncbi:Lysophospholipid acyltransferase [Fusarium oxysporum f. sp. albedinis]|nr:Lysophospholipid acyltransferase [Fusarium oxysporum f. sp. albedinis]
MSAMDPELYTIGLTYSHPSAPDSPFASEPGLRLDAEQEAIVLLQLSQPVVLETFAQTCECLFHDRHAWLPMLTRQQSRRDYHRNHSTERLSVRLADLRETSSNNILQVSKVQTISVTSIRADSEQHQDREGNKQAHRMLPRLEVGVLDQHTQLVESSYQLTGMTRQSPVFRAILESVQRHDSIARKLYLDDSIDDITSCNEMSVESVLYRIGRTAGVVMMSVGDLPLSAMLKSRCCVTKHFEIAKGLRQPRTDNGMATLPGRRVMDMLGTAPRR